MFYEPPSALRRMITHMLPVWLIGVTYTAYVTSEHMAHQTLGLSTNVMPNEVAIPLLVLFTTLVVLAVQLRPASSSQAGFNVGIHLLFAIASVPFLVVNGFAMLEVPASIVAEIAVAVAALASLFPGDRQIPSRIHG